MPNHKNPISNTLGNKILLKMTLRITLVFICTCIYTYYHNMNIYDIETLEYAEKYAASRAEIESEYYLNAEANVKVLQSDFLKKLAAITPEQAKTRFNEIMGQGEDGIWRTKDKYTDFKTYASAGILSTNKFDDKFYQSMITAYDIVSQYGPAFNVEYYDTFMQIGKVAGTIYFPEMDITRLPNIKEMLTNGYIETLGAPENSPDRKLYWTKIYFDNSIGKWMLSVTQPLYYQDNWIGSAGQDLLIDDSLTRLENITIPGTYNLIFNKKGQLVVSKEYKAEIEKSGGQLDINTIKDDKINQIWDTVETLDKNGSSVKSNANQAFLGVKKINGPDWVLVQVYPFSLISQKAKNSILTVLLITLLSLFVELYIIYRILRKDMAAPLAELVTTTGNIYTEPQFIKNSTSRNDELGALANSIKNMATEVTENKKNLEAKVLERTNELSILNNSLKEKNATLDILNHEKNEFISIANHDLKNPLSMIMLSTDLIKRKLVKNGNEKIYEKLDLVESQAKKMMEIINEYLNYVLIEENSSHTPKSIFNLTEIINLIILQNEISIKNKSLQLTKKIDPEVMINSSRNLCGVIFENLLSNAIKFTEIGKGITIELYQSNKSVFLRVSDEGLGIPKEEHHLVFQKFTRLSTKPTGNETSSGLGLSLVKQIAEKLGAKVSFESTHLLGTKFLVEFPKE